MSIVGDEVKLDTFLTLTLGTGDDKLYALTPLSWGKEVLVFIL
jgi:hypothetical protein